MSSTRSPSIARTSCSARSSQPVAVAKRRPIRKSRLPCMKKHGHTYRPGVHRFSIDGTAATRIVLGAWYEQGSVVRWDQNGFELETLER